MRIDRQTDRNRDRHEEATLWSAPKNESWDMLLGGIAC